MLSAKTLTYLILIAFALALVVGIIWVSVQNIAVIMNAFTASKVDKIEAMEDEPVLVGTGNQLQVLVEAQLG